MADNSHAIELINEPRDFAVEELFFSTTDLKGRIQQANTIFTRISGYSWEELKNKPHNVVRHPDMPRGIFHLFWEFIQSNRPIVAYVKNLAKDRRYYWVVALALPIPDGFLSVRFKPTSPLFAKVKELYAELRSAEASIENESKDRKSAIKASRDLLDSSLQKLGFNGYQEFMQEVLKQEMQSREALLQKSASPAAHRRTSESIVTAAQVTELDLLRKAARMFDELLEVLSVLFRDLEAYAAISNGVRAKSENVTDISESLRVSALNGAIETDRLGTHAIGLRPVLDWLRSFSGEITEEVARLSGSLGSLIREVDAVVFGLSSAKLQIEMTAMLAHELVNQAYLDVSGGSDRSAKQAMVSLHASACDTVRAALSNLTRVKNSLKGLTESELKLHETSRFLRPLYLTGKIEMAEGAGPKLAMVFSDVNEQLNETMTNLRGLKGLLEELESHLSGGLAHGERVEEMIGNIDAHLSSMAHAVV